MLHKERLNAEKSYASPNPPNVATQIPFFTSSHKCNHPYRRAELQPRLSSGANDSRKKGQKLYQVKYPHISKNGEEYLRISQT